MKIALPVSRPPPRGALSPTVDRFASNDRCRQGSVIRYCAIARLIARLVGCLDITQRFEPVPNLGDAPAVGLMLAATELRLAMPGFSQSRAEPPKFRQSREAGLV